MALRQAQAGEDGDLLPGMVALAQSWLDDVAFSSFRRTSSKPPDLDTWFTTPQVTLYLKVISPIYHRQHKLPCFCCPFREL